ncbi:MAG: hypothetical protein R8G66_31905 [Cytophagales bacterium]|nr:hypothetical protein [Cytophagales bacterium]
MPRIWNEGNERLLREIDIQYSFFTLFRVLSAGFFINAIFVTWWLELAGFEQWSLKIFVTLATLFLIFLGLTVYQKRVWDRLKIKAFKVVSGWYTSR